MVLLHVQAQKNKDNIFFFLKDEEVSKSIIKIYLCV